ncbi:MAG: hypothetical protein JNJ54_34940 [Myxococcaceae bacterium]|nr:hypothetical protein [Myxococcaceae bacterium]
MSGRKRSSQLRVADGYVRLVVDSRGKTFNVRVDHQTGGPTGWAWQVTDEAEMEVLLVGEATTYAEAVRRAFRAAELASLEDEE